MATLVWNTEKRIRFLGQADAECKKNPPTALDRETLKAYGQRCGTAIALDWVTDETGVDVQGCAKSSAGGVAECIANNYGVTLEVVQNGKVNWDNCARDAGAVGGITVCAISGAGAPALPYCGKIGAEVGHVLGILTVSVGKAIINIFWSGDDGGGIACEKSPGGVGWLEMSRAIARYMKYGPTGKAAGDQMLGPVLSATPGYWDRLLKISGLAQATAAVLSEMAFKAGTSPATALRFLAPEAPDGWTEIVRPAFDPLDPKSAWPDYIMNAGGLLAVLYNPRILEATTIKPRWQTRAFWSGLEPKSKTEPVVWYYFVTARGCPNNVTNWGEIVNYDYAKKLLAEKGGTASLEYDWWVYSIPKTTDLIIRNLPDGEFDVMISLWKASLEKNLAQKIAAAKTASVGSSGGLAPLAVGAAIAAFIVWALL